MDDKAFSGCGIPKKVDFYGETHYYIKSCEDGREFLFRDREMETAENRVDRAKEGMKLIKQVS